MRTRTEAFYWLASLTMRTTATNLGDMMKHELAIPWLLALGGLAAALVAVQVAEKFLAPRQPEKVATGIPNTNAFYWVTMLIAGTLGTTAGDYFAGRHGLNWGLPISSAVWAVPMIGLLLLWRTPNRDAIAAPSAPE